MEAVIRGVKSCCHELLQKQTDALLSERCCYRWHLSGAGTVGWICWTALICASCIFRTSCSILAKCVMLGNPRSWGVVPTHSPLGF